MKKLGNIKLDDVKIWISEIECLFNKLELNKLKSYKFFISDNEKFMNVYDIVYKGDTRTLVNETKPAFHKAVYKENSTEIDTEKICEFLKKDYVNYKIPLFLQIRDKYFQLINSFKRNGTPINKARDDANKLIVSRLNDIDENPRQYLFENKPKVRLFESVPGSELEIWNDFFKKRNPDDDGKYYDANPYEKSELDVIKKYRDWFKEKNMEMIIENKLEAFLMRVESRFGVKKGLLKEEDFIRKGKNSGIQKKENITKSEREESIKTLLEHFYYYSTSNSKISTIFGFVVRKTFLRKNDYKLESLRDEIQTRYRDIDISIKDLSNILETIDIKFKQPLFDHLMDYWRLVLNPNLKFDKPFLETLKFKKCSVCFPDTVSSEYEGSWNTDDLPF
tara:strand:- start:2645 stop:3820 length:1176 start_codon:yes stop_codon:yes gene_type:complete